MNGVKPPDEAHIDFEDDKTSTHEPAVARLTVEAVLEDLRLGIRTKGFLQKYGISLPEFESLLKMLLRKGLFTKEDFKRWKAARPEPNTTVSHPGPPAQETPPAVQGAQASSSESGPTSLTKNQQTIETFVISDPEQNNSWTLELFSRTREDIRGATFKGALQGKKYMFIIEDLLFRGTIHMMEDANEPKAKRQEAIDFISKHGWAAYLERRAFEANFGEDSAGPKVRSEKKGRLVVLRCRHDTYLAALHTPTPAINVYVGSSFAKLKARLARNVDISELTV